MPNSQNRSHTPLTPNERADAIAGFVLFMICWGMLFVIGCMKLWDHELSLAIVSFIAAAFCGSQCNSLGEQLSAKQR